MRPDLWRIDKAGAVSAIGPVPAGQFVRVNLTEPAEKVLFTAVELVVSVEPLGSSPVAPTQAFVYRGLCGSFGDNGLFDRFGGNAFRTKICY